MLTGEEYYVKISPVNTFEAYTGNMAVSKTALHGKAFSGKARLSVKWQSEF